MFLPYGHQSINEDDVAAVSEALKGELITRGQKVAEFETAVAEYVGATYAVAFTSGSTALAASYWALEVGPQDRVLTTPNSFIATTGYASEKGATVAFVDIERSSGNFNLAQVEHNLSFRSLKGKLFVVPVHFAGIAVDMEKLHAMSKAANIVVIEDAAHAIGSRYPDGRRVGCCAYSDCTIFSFHPVKTMTTAEGGMVTTNDPELYKRLLRYRNSGIVRDAPDLEENPAPWYYEVPEITGNFNFTEMQAALGISQLKRLDAFVEKRRALVQRYREKLSGLKGVTLFDPVHDALSAYHLMVVQIDYAAYRTTRTAVMDALQQRGTGSQLHYVPLYRHPCYRKTMGELEEYFPEMETYYSQALSLPLYYDLKVEEVDQVVNGLREILSYKPR